MPLSSELIDFGSELAGINYLISRYGVNEIRAKHLATNV
jgi:hypothetical protein